MPSLRRLVAVLMITAVAVLSSGPASATGRQRTGERLTLGGPPISTSIATFTAAKGDRLTVVLRRGTLPVEDAFDLVIRGPGGAEATRGTLYWSRSLAAIAVDARVTGDYTAEVLPSAGRQMTGTGSLQLAGSTRQTTTLNGKALRLHIRQPGERAFATFPATAGQLFSVAGQVDDDEGASAFELTVRDVRGELISNFFEPVYETGGSSKDLTAPQTGTYTLELTAPEGATGMMTVFVTAPGTPMPATVNGPEFRTSVTVPGGRSLVTFPATAGDRLLVVARGTGLENGSWLDLEARGPDGKRAALLDSGSAAMSVLDLEVRRTGRHVLEINPVDWATGRFAVAILTPATAEARIGGPAVSLDLDRPGKSGIAAFQAGAGQRLAVITRSTSTTSEDAKTEIKIRSPYGTEIGTGSLGYGAESHLADIPFTAPVAGRYTVEVVADGPATGRYTVQIGGSSTVTAKVGGPAVQARATGPGGRAFVGFDVTAGRRLDVVLRAGDLPAGGAVVTVRAPDGGELGGCSMSATDDEPETLTFVARAAGRYLLEVDPHLDQPGSVTVEVQPAD
ncbi:hypothetical protein AB0G04_29050 [Actinoplanes sp. NPDC023801]|uniref:hypothetical protein n=1 Tax=Actinoplanes sp. NPDC023801 TaxID=3154595 RepID=UPI0033D8A22E